MAVNDEVAPKVWKGLTLNTNQMHDEYAKRTRFGKALVNSCLTLSLIAGLSVPDTSENATANLGWTDIKLLRTFMIYKRDAPEVTDTFPGPTPPGPSERTP